MPEETTERKPFGGEHRNLTTADLDELADYLKSKGGRSSSPRKRSSSPSSSSSSSKSKSGGKGK